MRDLGEIIESLHDDAPGADDFTLRVLSNSIAFGCGWTRTMENGHVVWFSPKGKRAISAPDYTRSIDAALTLLPDDLDWLLNRRANFACVWQSKESGRDGRWESHGCSVAVALCIAALKARLALTPAQRQGES
jgi:hypothetical protein